MGRKGSFLSEPVSGSGLHEPVWLTKAWGLHLPGGVGGFQTSPRVQVTADKLGLCTWGGPAGTPVFTWLGPGWAGAKVLLGGNLTKRLCVGPHPQHCGEGQLRPNRGLKSWLRPTPAWQRRPSVSGPEGDTAPHGRAATVTAEAACLVLLGPARGLAPVFVQGSLRDNATLQSLSHVQLFVIPQTAARQLPCPSPSPRLCSNPCPSSQWCHPTISSSVVPFSPCLQSCPASGSSPTSQLFASGGLSIGASASASVLPMKWTPRTDLLRDTGWISLQSKGLSGVFSNTTVQKHQLNSLALSFLHSPTLTSIHDHWKNHSFDYRDLCQQRDHQRRVFEFPQGKHHKELPLWPEVPECMLKAIRSTVLSLTAITPTLYWAENFT